MNLTKLSYTEWIICFLLIIVFTVSIAVILLNHQADSVEDRVTTVEQQMTH